MSSMSIPPVSQIIPQAIAPAQPAQAPAWDGLSPINTVTINLKNNIPLPPGAGNLAFVNEVEIQGSNNNITINETNNFIVQATDPASNTAGSFTGGIVPNINADGSVSFTDTNTNQPATLADFINALLQQLTKTLLDSEKQQSGAAAAYNNTQNLTTPAPSGQVALTV